MVEKTDPEIEAWAIIVGDLLDCVPDEKRAAVLKRAQWLTLVSVITVDRTLRARAPIAKPILSGRGREETYRASVDNYPMVTDHLMQIIKAMEPKRLGAPWQLVLQDSQPCCSIIFRGWESALNKIRSPARVYAPLPFFGWRCFHLVASYDREKQKGPRH